MYLYHLYVYLYQCHLFSIARKASWGTSTFPILFIFFFPSFCFWSSFIFRVTSPPYYKEKTTMFSVTWLAQWAGTMNRIQHCDWLPERARWRYLARSGFPAVSRKKWCLFHLSLCSTKLNRSRWLDIGLVLFLRGYRPRYHRCPETRKTKKRAWPISSHLDQSSLVNDPSLLYL